MKKCSMAAQYPLGSSHKLRLQLGWVGSQQNANQGMMIESHEI